MSGLLAAGARSACGRAAGRAVTRLGRVRRVRFGGRQRSVVLAGRVAARPLGGAGAYGRALGLREQPAVVVAVVGRRVGRRGVPELDGELDAAFGGDTGARRLGRVRRLVVEESRNLTGDLLEQAQRRTA